MVCAALLITGLVADVRIVGGFNDGLRNASLELGREFTDTDSLLTSAGKAKAAEDPTVRRVCGAERPA